MFPFGNFAGSLFLSGIVRFTFLAVAGCLFPFTDEAVVLDVTILLAMEAERPFLGGPGSPGLILTLLSGRARVELSEPVLLVSPLFLAGNSFDGRFVLFFREEYSSLAAAMAAALVLALRW